MSKSLSQLIIDRKCQTIIGLCDSEPARCLALFVSKIKLWE